MSKNWLKYWDAYRRSDVISEDDLFVQVGKTINKQPIPDTVFKSMIERITRQLELTSSDHLLDICCGNGLVTKELSRHVRTVTAIDFAEHLVISARKFKSASNIDYRVGDVISAFGDWDAGIPDKVLMNDALAYFNPASLLDIIDGLLRLVDSRKFRFLLTGIPNKEQKWNFYDTPERRERHLRNEAAEPDVNDGLGRWWTVEDLKNICSSRGLSLEVEHQPPEISSYRMDAMVWKS